MHARIHMHCTIYFLHVSLAIARIFNLWNVAHTDTWNTPQVTIGRWFPQSCASNVEDETDFNLKASSNFRICMHINTLYSFFESQLSLDYCAFMLLAIFRAQNFLHRVCFNRSACQNGEAAEANLQESH